MQQEQFNFFDSFKLVGVSFSVFVNNYEPRNIYDVFLYELEDKYYKYGTPMELAQNKINKENEPPMGFEKECWDKIVQFIGKDSNLISLENNTVNLNRQFDVFINELKNNSKHQKIVFNGKNDFVILFDHPIAGKVIYCPDLRDKSYFNDIFVIQI